MKIFFILNRNELLMYDVPEQFRERDKPDPPVDSRFGLLLFQKIFYIFKANWKS